MRGKKRVYRELSAEKILAAFDAKRYTVVAFENGRRVSTYVNLDLVSLSQEVLLLTSRGQRFMVFEAWKEPIGQCANIEGAWENAVRGL